MARSAREYRQTPLSIKPFSERATRDPPIRWEKWRTQVKLAIIARENITLDTLLEPKSTRVKLPPERKYEAPTENATEQTERERQIRNKQLKLQWYLMCQKKTEAGMLCGKKSWTSPFFISASELRAVVSLRRRFLMTTILRQLKLRKILENAFIRPCNIIFDRHVLFSKIQKKRETVEQF